MELTHEELREQLKDLEKKYDEKEFQAIVYRVKNDKINDDALLAQINSISHNRFMEKNLFTVSVSMGNSIELFGTLTALGLAFYTNHEWIFYLIALILMTTLHPLSHYLAGTCSGIRFTHYYLNGPAKIEPTLRIDYASYLRTDGEKRAMMHLSGVIGTVSAPLIAAALAFGNGASTAAFNLVILFVLLIVFELLTSTKIGDLMKAKREYGFR